MWPLWTTLLLVLPLGGLGPPLCRREPFYFLIAITKMLGNKNDGSLYTPDNLLVCPAETLRCFRLELSVIGPKDLTLRPRSQGKRYFLLSLLPGRDNAHLSFKLIPIP
ncbi:uncharacterized protein ACBT57_010293 isoform 2-T6 [Dama dama]